MKTTLLISALLLQASSFVVTGFSTASSRTGLRRQSILQRPSGVAQSYSPSLPLQVASSSSSAQDQPASTDDKADKKKDELKKLRAHGGPLTFNTPIGALNPFAIYYGLMSLFLGIPWFIALKSCQFLYWITGGRFDQKVRLNENYYSRDLTHMRSNLPMGCWEDWENYFFSGFLDVHSMLLPFLSIFTDKLLLFHSDDFLYFLVTCGELYWWDYLVLIQKWLVWKSSRNSSKRIKLHYLSPTTVLGWIFHFWVQPWAGGTISSFPKRSYVKFQFWEPQLLLVEISLLTVAIADLSLRRSKMG